MIKRLLDLAEKIERKDLREQVLEFLERPVITFADVTPKISLEESPAAPKNHHSYRGGLIDHTEGVARIGMALSDLFNDIYGLEVDKDYVLAGALLHDLFKYYQYEPDPVTGGFRQRSDWWLSHEYAIVVEMGIRKMDDYLIRVVSQAHGVGPVYTPEGHVLHLADSTDAKFGQKVQDIIFRACIDIERECEGRVLAVKVFTKFMEDRTIFDVAPLLRKSVDDVRDFIKKELGIECPGSI